MGLSLEQGRVELYNVFAKGSFITHLFVSFRPKVCVSELLTCIVSLYIILSSANKKCNNKFFTTQRGQIKFDSNCSTSSRNHRHNRDSRSSQFMFQFFCLVPRASRSCVQFIICNSSKFTQVSPSPQHEQSSREL